VISAVSSGDAQAYYAEVLLKIDELGDLFTKFWEVADTAGSRIDVISTLVALHDGNALSAVDAEMRVTLEQIADICSQTSRIPAPAECAEFGRQSQGWCVELQRFAEICLGSADGSADDAILALYQADVYLSDALAQIG
jgi:hypothetical protein